VRSPLRAVASACALMLVAAGTVASLPFVEAAQASQPSTWHSVQANISEAAQAQGRGGAGVVVAVVDTGLDASHPDLQGRVVPGIDCTSGSCTGADTSPGQCTDAWHGTHTAGTVASRSYGVAPQALIMPIKVLSGATGKACTGGSTEIATGIRWAVDHGARVVSLSLGGDLPFVTQTFDSNERDAAAYAAGKGVLVTFAAGNASYPLTDSYGSDALVVTATGPSGSLASYAQSGAFVSVAAPGGDCPTDSTGRYVLSPDCAVTSTYPGGGFALSIGTSMATPHVSGLAALLIAQHPELARTDVVSAIESTATPLTGAGSGLINVAKALALRPISLIPATQGATGTGSSTGNSAGPSPASRATPASFLRCPSTIRARKGTRAVLSCTRRSGSGIVRLQQRTSRGWVTVATVTPKASGQFRAYTRKLTGAQTLRLVTQGRTGTVTHNLRAALRS
jgi:subtilisin family serine protease